MFYVYETNADLEPVKMVYKGFHKDILETRMVKAFSANECSTDYMLYDSVHKEISSLMLSDRSKLLRGECLG